MYIGNKWIFMVWKIKITDFSYAHLTDGFIFFENIEQIVWLYWSVKIPIVFAVEDVRSADMLVHMVYSTMMAQFLIQTDQVPIRTEFFEHLICWFIAKVIDGDDWSESPIVRQAA